MPGRENRMSKARGRNPFPRQASGPWKQTARLPKSSETSEVSGYAMSGRSTRTTFLGRLTGSLFSPAS